jgi:hypothetical protein
VCRRMQCTVFFVEHSALTGNREFFHACLLFYTLYGHKYVLVWSEFFLENRVMIGF